MTTRPPSDTPSFHLTGSATSGEISLDWRPSPAPQVGTGTLRRISNDFRCVRAPDAPPGRGRRGRAGSACGSIHPRPSPSRLSGNPPKRLGPVEQRTSREWKLRSGPRPSPTSTTCPSYCCLAWPASPTRLGATRGWPPGPTTAIASLGTADCGRKTASRTSAPWTGFSARKVRHADRSCETAPPSIGFRHHDLPPNCMSRCQSYPTTGRHAGQLAWDRRGPR